MARKDLIDDIRTLPTTRRDALRKALAGDLSMLAQLREQVGGDVVDAAPDSTQDELSSQLAEVESRELASIEKALASIKAGSYGLCEHCGGKIKVARLKALPYATSCIECQRASESGAAGGFVSGDWSRVFDTGATDTEVSARDLEIQ